MQWDWTVLQGGFPAGLVRPPIAYVPDEPVINTRTASPLDRLPMLMDLQGRDWVVLGKNRCELLRERLLGNQVGQKGADDRAPKPYLNRSGAMQIAIEPAVEADHAVNVRGQRVLG